MKKILLLIVFWVAAASQPPADSLNRRLAQTSSDIDRARLYNALAESYKSSDPAKMRDAAQQALSLSRKISDRYDQGTALLHLGNAAVIAGKYPEALREFSDAQTLFEQETAREGSRQNREGLARAYGSIGIVFSEQSDYARALEFSLKAVRIYEQLRDAAKAARVYNNIGIVYQAQGDLFKALEYFQKCLQLQQKSADATIGITMTNIGNVYLAQNNPGKAKEYYDQATQAFGKHPDARGLGELYNNIGRYFQATGNFTQSVAQYQMALKTFAQIGDQFGSSDTYALLGEAYFLKKDYPKALEFTNRSLELGRALNVQERIRDSEQKLSDIYAATGDQAKALAHFRLYAAAKDSVSNFENVRNSIRAEMNYAFDQKQAQQQRQQERREIVYREQAKRHTMQMVFLTLLLLLLGGMTFMVYSRRQLRKQLTLEKELAEYEQKALHLQMNPHFVFNCLGSISSFIVQNGSDQALKYLSKFSKLMRLTLEYSKEPLIPIDKEIESLRNYLELEQLRFNNVFTFDISKSAEIEDDMAIPPLLLQPFVENAIIHGLVPKKQPGHIGVAFTVDGDTLVCRIADTGIGIDTSQQLKESLLSVHKSMALDITRKRLQMMESYTGRQARVEISQGESGGTQVVLTLPVQYIKN
jgi:tetratricopeptide (TPR) repeat protein